MASVYSVRLADGTQGVGTAAIYTAPSGFTIVVRQITLVAFGGCTLAAIYRQGPTAYLAGSLQIPAAGLFIMQEGRWVLNPGDVLEAQFLTAGGTYHLSGYQLD